MQVLPPKNQAQHHYSPSPRLLPLRGGLLSAELLCQPAYPMMRQEPFIIDSFGTHDFRHALRSRYPQRRCRPLVRSRHFGRLRLYKPTILDSKPTTEFRTTIPLAFKLRFFAVRAKLVFALRHILLDPCPFFWIGLLSPREDFSTRRLTPRLPFFATAFRRWQGLFSVVKDQLDDPLFPALSSMGAV